MTNQELTSSVTFDEVRVLLQSISEGSLKTGKDHVLSLLRILKESLRGFDYRYLVTTDKSGPVPVQSLIGYSFMTSAQKFMCVYSFLLFRFLVAVFGSFFFWLCDHMFTEQTSFRRSYRLTGLPVSQMCVFCFGSSLSFNLFCVHVFLFGCLLC